MVCVAGSSVTSEGTDCSPSAVEVGDALEAVSATLGTSELTRATTTLESGPPDPEITVASVVLAVDDCVEVAASSSSSSSSSCASDGHPVVHGSTAQQPAQTT